MVKKIIFVLCISSACLVAIANDDIVVAQPVSFTYRYFYSAYGEYTGTLKRFADNLKTRTGTQNASMDQHSVTITSNRTSYSMGGASRTQTGGVLSSFGPGGGYISFEGTAHMEGGTENIRNTNNREQNASQNSAAQTDKSKTSDTSTHKMDTSNPTLTATVTIKNLTKNDTFRFETTKSKLILRIKNGAVLKLPCKQDGTDFVSIRPQSSTDIQFEEIIRQDVLVDAFDGKDSDGLKEQIEEDLSEFCLINERNRSSAIFYVDEATRVNVDVAFGQVCAYGPIPCVKRRNGGAALTYREVLDAVNDFLFNNRPRMPEHYFEFAGDGCLLNVGGEEIGKVNGPEIVIVNIGGMPCFSVSADMLRKPAEGNVEFRKVKLSVDMAENLNEGQRMKLFDALSEAPSQIKDTEDGIAVLASLSQRCATNAVDSIISYAEKGDGNAKKNLVAGYLSDTALSESQCERIIELIETKKISVGEELCDEHRFVAAITRPSWKRFFEAIRKCGKAALPKSAILIAAQHRQCAVLKFLLKNYADLDKNFEEDGMRAIDWAIKNDDVMCFEMLWQNGAKAHGDRSNLIVASECASTNILQNIFSANVRYEIDEEDVKKDQDTPLMLAAKAGSITAVKMLIAKGADVRKAKKERTANGKEKNAEFYARVEGFDRIAELLHSYSEIAMIRDSRFSARGYPQGVSTQKIREWVSSGVSPNESLGCAKYRGGDWSLYTWAIVKRDDKLLEFLIDNGADVNDKTNPSPIEGYTALMLAAQTGNTNLLTKLIAKGLSVTAKDNRGWTALMYATLAEKVAAMKILVEHAADVNVVDNETGKTALCMAIEKANCDAVRLLWPKSNRNLTIKSDWRDLNFYQFAAMYLKDKELLENIFADLKLLTADKDGITPLMAAAYAGNLEAVKFVVDLNKAGIYERDKKGWFGKPGKSALDYAKDQGKADVVKYLESLDVEKKGNAEKAKEAK